jgi:D-inositol-3-phosphate glycosyltransferase
MKILWVGDAACDSGFARCTHETLKGFQARGDEIVVLGINYRGDPHSYPYRIFPAWLAPGDAFGVMRIHEMMFREKPDVIVFQNDPWNIPAYMRQVKKALADEINLIENAPLLVGAIAVDGKNCRGRDLNDLDVTMFWTQFAADEAVKGGYDKPYFVLPLGVDTDKFRPPVDADHREHAWEKLGLPDITRDGFFFLNVNRNQPRKHLELTVSAFASFLQWWKEENAHSHEILLRWPYLYLHVCPTGEVHINLDQLGGYYGLKGHLILAEPGVFHAAPEEELIATYQRADVQLTTTQGEGWGLTTMEGMACGVPQIVPDWSALGEWTEGAAVKVPCNQFPCTPGLGVIGGVPDQKELVKRMKQLYLHPKLRQDIAAIGLKLVSQDRFRWSNIGTAFAKKIHSIVDNG